jgi:hypothetical protein
MSRKNKKNPKTDQSAPVAQENPVVVEVNHDTPHVYDVQMPKTPGHTLGPGNAPKDTNKNLIRQNGGSGTIIGGE